MDGSKCPLPNYDQYDLADNLAIYMEEEFSVTLEDNSEKQVAEAIFNMYEGCYNGDPTLVRQMIAHAEGAVNLNKQFPVQIQTTEHDDDDDDEDMGDSLQGQASTNIPQLTPIAPPQMATPMATIAEYNAQPLFGQAKKPQAPTGPVRQLGESAPAPAPVEMDEDGFAAVKPKGRRRKPV